MKSGKDYTVHSAINKFLSNKDYHVDKGIVLSNHREICEKGSVLYLPIYMVMFF